MRFRLKPHWWLMMCGVFLLAGKLEASTGISVFVLGNRSVACVQPKAPGLCRGRQLRYAFNQLTGNCESFYYTGCASTQNNFLTFEECRRDCMQRLRY